MSSFGQIVWLSSYPKSGNTWVRLFLDAYFLGEIDINDVVCSIPDDIATRHHSGLGQDPKELPIDIQQLTRPMALLRMVQQYHENKIEGIPLFVKSHNANMIANGIELIPKSLTKAVIFIVRDPRDVAISFAKHMGSDVDQAIEWMKDKYRVLSDSVGYKMADFISSWDDHTKSYLACDTHNTKFIRYEDLKAEPVKYFTEILEHAGVQIDSERVKQAIQIVELGNLKKHEKEQGFKESSPHAKNQFFGDGKAGGWKGKLSPLQQRRIEKYFGHMMSKFNYIDKAKKWA